MHVVVGERPFSGTIPKLIHQTHFTSEFPDIIAANVAKLKKLNPEWEYRFYDDEAVADFISQHYGAEVRRVFNSINPEYGAARADLFRYLALYWLGGIYLDIKSTADRPLADVLRPDDSFILSQWHGRLNSRGLQWGRHPELSHIPDGEYQQWYIIAAPGHPFLQAVINRVLWNIRNYDIEVTGAGRRGVLRLTGPIPYSQAIYPLLGFCPHRFVKGEAELGFRYSIFEHDGNQNHRELFKTHYRALNTPIVMNCL